MAARTPRNKHVKHQSVSRQRRSNMSAFLSEQAFAKQVPERALRDCIYDIGSKSPAEVEAAATAALAGATRAAITGTIAQTAPVTPGTLQYGAPVIGGSQLRQLRFGATSGAITVDFDATANTITRASGSFITDGFVVGGKLAISGAADAGNNSSTPTITDVQALVITCDDIAADEVGDADVTLVQTNSIHDLNGFAFTGRAGAPEVGDPIVITGAGDHNGTYLFVAEPVDGTMVVTDNAETPADPGFDATVGITSGSLTVTFEADDDSITRGADSFITDGFTVGSKVVISGAADAGNNSVFTLASVAALVMTVDGAITDEAGDTGVTINQLASVSFGSPSVDFGIEADFVALDEDLTIRKGVSTKTVLVDIDGTAESITRLSAGSFLDEGFEVGGSITIVDPAEAGNDGTYTIDTVTATEIVVTGDLTDSAGTTITISQAAQLVAETEDLEVAGFGAGVVIELRGSTHNDGVYTVTAANGATLTVTPSPKQTETLASVGQLFGRNVIAGLYTSFTTLATGAILDISGGDGEVDGQFEVVSDAVSAAAVIVADTGGAPGHGPFGAKVLQDRSGTLDVVIANCVIRGAGDFETDGFSVGERIVISNADEGINGTYVVTVASGDYLLLEPAFAAFQEPTALSTLIGAATLTRGSGSWAADGFPVDTLIALTGTLGTGSVTTGSITVDFAVAGTITRASGSFITDGFVAGDVVSISGAADAGNNGIFTVKSVQELVLTLEQALSAETGDAGVTITKGINDGVYRISKVNSTTVIELPETLVAESGSATMVVWKLNERAGRA